MVAHTALLFAVGGASGQLSLGLMTEPPGDGGGWWESFSK